MCLIHKHLPAHTNSVTFIFVDILWTVHRDTHLWERPTICTLFHNNLFQLKYPKHVSNKQLFIIRRSVQAAYSILSCWNYTNVVWLLTFVCPGVVR